MNFKLVVKSWYRLVDIFLLCGCHGIVSLCFLLFSHHGIVVWLSCHRVFIGRILNQRILELEANLEDLAESHQRESSADSATGSELRQKLSEQIQKTTNLNTKLHSTGQHIEDLEQKLGTRDQEVASLQDQIRKKEEEMKVMEEKYRKYLEKARNVSMGYTDNVNFMRKKGHENSAAVAVWYQELQYSQCRSLRLILCEFS